MIVQFRNEKVSNHGSIPITIDCNVVAFIVFEEGFHQPIKRTKQWQFIPLKVEACILAIAVFETTDKYTCFACVFKMFKIQAVEAKISVNKRFTINNPSLEFSDVSRSVVYKIVTEDLNFKKLCSRWVPRLLTAEHKEKRFAISLDFLIRYEEEGDDMLSRILAGDETWVSHIIPESEQQSMEWRHTSSPV
ncbi:uncharacterized protein TNCV_4053841 [Trichonephila clavipes]|nr:uncharacterized protein TNCV_4053841 [Trichonephila clavipes]